jgi:hypothetical protein
VIAASYCQLDFASSAVGDNMVVCAETAIGRSIVPAVFSSSPSPEVTPPLQPSRERESRERVSGRGGGFQSGPLLAPPKKISSFPHTIIEASGLHVIVTLVVTSHLESDEHEQLKTNPAQSN